MSTETKTIASEAAPPSAYVPDYQRYDKHFEGLDLTEEQGRDLL